MYNFSLTNNQVDILIEIVRNQMNYMYEENHPFYDEYIQTCCFCGTRKEQIVEKGDTQEDLGEIGHRENCEGRAILNALQFSYEPL